MGEITDTAAYHLLGWPVQSNKNGNSIGTQKESAVGDVEDQENDWASLHYQVRNSADGANNFRRAVQILSGNRGLIDFIQVGSRNDTDVVGNKQEAFLVIRGYFRLMRYALEPAAVAPSAGASPIAEEEWLRMAISLLKQLGTLLKCALQRELDEMTQQNSSSLSAGAAVSSTNSASDSSMRNKSILYYLQHILQDIHPHVMKQVRILGPTYRSFCEVSDSFLSILEIEKCQIENIASVLLPSRGLGAIKGLSMCVEKLNAIRKLSNGHLRRATMHLMRFLDDGLRNMQLALLFASSNDGDGDSAGHAVMISAPEQQSKIIVFLLARIISLIRTTRRFRACAVTTNNMMVGNNNIRIDGKAGNDLVDEEKGLAREAILRLTHIRGFSAAAQGSLEGTMNSCHKAIFEMTAGLGIQAERYLVKLLELSDLSSDINEDVICIGLECLIDLPFNHANNTSGSASISNEEIGNSCCMIFNNPLPVGKLLMMKSVLKNLFPSIPASNSTSAYLPRSTPIIKLCESILFTVIPQCHHFLISSSSPSGRKPQNWVSEILNDLVGHFENATHVFFLPEKVGDIACSNDIITRVQWQKAIKQQHNLLVRWLAPISLSKNQHPSTPSSSNHPLTNELLLSMMHALIVSSHDTYSKADSMHLVSLLAKLLFHQRTDSSHRRNIATLLIRLLSHDNQHHLESASVQAKSLVIQIMWSELKKSTIWNSPMIMAKEKTSGRKRKRQSINLLQDDVRTIGWVLESLAKMTILSQSHVDSEFCQEMIYFWDNVLANKGKVHSSLKGKSFHKKVFLASLSTGAMSASSDVAALFLALSNDGISRNVTSRKFIDSVLAYIDSQLSSLANDSADSSRDLITRFVCIRFIHSLAGFLGSEFSEVQVRQAGDFIKNIGVFASTNSICAESINLQYDAICAASAMGCTIQSEFSNASLQVSFCLFVYRDDAHPLIALQIIV